MTKEESVGGQKQPHLGKRLAMAQIRILICDPIWAEILVWIVR